MTYLFIPKIKLVNLFLGKQTLFSYYVCVCVSEGMLTLRAKPPSEGEFIDCLQKLKLSFNLLVGFAGLFVSERKACTLF